VSCLFKVEREDWLKISEEADEHRQYVCHLLEGKDLYLVLLESYKSAQFRTLNFWR
jgi:hypothetical protein